MDEQARQKLYTSIENLALKEGVQIQVSLTNPTGAAARNPYVLLNETAYQLDGQPLSAFLKNRSNTYDTYDGHNQASGPDWYAIEFPEPIQFNSIDMTMECPNRDGGWWVALDVEAKYSHNGEWQCVEHLSIDPPYIFDDSPLERQPYTTHALTFDTVFATAIRVIGKPGGLAEFTSLARLAVYCRDLTRWNPVSLPTPPIPYIFRLISPASIWDLSESLVKLTGLSVSLPYMDHYLDTRRYEQWWRRLSRNYQGYPELWQLVGASIGWNEWRRIEYGTDFEEFTPSSKEPYVQIGFHNTIARAVAPIVVDGEVLGEMASHTVILKGNFDEGWHFDYAKKY